MRIPLFRPVVCEEAIQAVAEVLRSGWLGLGAGTAAFEEAFARYVGAPHCVAMSSCTAALQLALRLLNLPPGTEVITTALTFVATNHVILHERLKPVFADIQPDSGNLDVDSVAARITDRTGAIMLVHFGGYPCDLDDFHALSRRCRIPIIEDCAHACGATYRGRPIGSHGDLHAFSFHASKNLCIGDGGALSVRQPEHNERLRRLRCLGIDRDVFRRRTPDSYNWDYNVTEVGYKCYMNDVQAALGLAQLAHVDRQNARRAQLAELYRQRLADVPGIELLCRGDDRTSSHHLSCVLAEERDGLVEKLAAEGVEVGVHFRRNDHYPMYEATELPATERFWSRAISLPMHLHLTEQHVDYITDVIRGGWSKRRRAA